MGGFQSRKSGMDHVFASNRCLLLKPRSRVNVRLRLGPSTNIVLLSQLCGVLGTAQCLYM